MQVALNRREHDVWGIVRVPYPDTEDSRQLHRELEVLKEERKKRNNTASAFSPAVYARHRRQGRSEIFNEARAVALLGSTAPTRTDEDPESSVTTWPFFRRV